MQNNNEEYPRLDALDWLGRGIDMTALTPFNIKSAQKLVKDHFIVETDKDPKQRIVTISNIEYKVPSIVSASTKSSTTADYITHESGTQALRAFTSGSPGTADQLVVKTNLSSYPLEKSFPANYQFAFWAYRTDVYTASLREYIDFIDEGALVEALDVLPKPFKDAPDVVEAYEEFFKKFGTHVITGTTFGARCSAAVWGSNEFPEVRKNWSRDVTAHLRGLNNRGEYDDQVRQEEQYELFETLTQTLFSTVGGNDNLAEKLNQGYYDSNAFQEWAETARDHSVLTTIVAMELWNLLRESDVKKLRDGADALEEAFKAIVAHQKERVVTTLVIMESVSLEAEIDLLTPGATVGVGGPLPMFDPTTQNVIGLSATKVRLGQGDKWALTRKVVPFYIVNDGTPIDISLKRASGYVKVELNGETLDNDDRLSQDFYQVPVSFGKYL